MSSSPSDSLAWLSDFANKKKLNSVEAGQLRTLHDFMLHLQQERDEYKAALDRALAQARQPTRIRLPDTRASVTKQFKVPTITAAGENCKMKVYLTAGCYPDGQLGEVFVHADKTGSLTSGAFDAVATAISIGLQYGVPLEAFTSKLIGTQFEPRGFTGDKEYPTCTSVLDLIGRWLRDRFGKKDVT